MLTAANAPPPEQDPGFSLVGLANIGLRYRAMILLTAAAVVAAISLMALAKPRTYTATSTFMLQGSGRAAGIAGLAAQLGIQPPVAENTESPQFYVDLVRSREILRAAAESVYTLRGSAGTATGDLATILNTQGRSERERTEGAMGVLARSIGTLVNTRTGVVTLSVTTGDPGLSAQLATRLLALVNEYNRERRQSRAIQERQFTGQRLAEATSELREAENRLETFLRQNRVFASPALIFQQDRLRREVAMRQQIYTTLGQAYETARIEAIRDSPVITVIDPPQAPLHPDARGLVKRALFAGFAGLFLGVMVAFARHSVTRQRTTGASEMSEFHALSREAIDDLRHPLRAVGRQLRRQPTVMKRGQVAPAVREG